MADGDVVHLVVIDLGIPVSEYVPETDYLPGMGDLLRDSRSGFVKTIHRLPANLQNPLYCGSGLLICKYCSRL